MPGLVVALSVLFLGDSITAARTSGVDTGYVELVSGRQPDWELVNAGLGGATSDFWSRHARFFDGQREWDAVVLLLGTNDAIRQTALADYAADMLRIAEVFDETAPVFLMRPPPVGSARFPAAQAVLDDYWVWLAAQSPGGADFSDLDPRAFDSIEVHPLQVGHDVMADRVEAMLLSIPEPTPVALLLAGLVAFARMPRRQQRRSDG